MKMYKIKPDILFEDKLINIPMLSAEDTKSFAYYTITQRFPNIINSILTNNNFTEETTKKIKKILQKIPFCKLDLLPETTTVNIYINDEIKKYSYKWSSAPFIFVENYFYHLLKEIIQYETNKEDYFFFKKRDDTISKKSKFDTMIMHSEHLFYNKTKDSLLELLYLNIIGNNADLSHINKLESDNLKLLIDNTTSAVKVIRNAHRIDIILDNAGEELLYDLILACHILHNKKNKTVTLHFKTMPYFVSDALLSDFYFLLEELSRNPNNHVFITSINEYIQNRQLILCEETIWSDTISYRSAKQGIKECCPKSDLLIFKGDLNYRKLVEDRKWNYTTNTSDILKYLPTNCLIIRILKSEIITGLQANNIPDMKNNEWKSNGTCGIIQFIEK